MAIGGGVAANQSLRRALEEMCAAESAAFLTAPPEYCTDNAAMAALAVEHWKQGQFAPPDLDAEPNLI